MKTNDMILLKGQFVLRALKPGVLQSILSRGIPYRVAIGRLPRTAIVAEIIVQNLVVSAGKEMLGDWMIAALTPGALSFHGIGTGATTPSVSDTELETEVGRVAFASRSRVGNIITLSAFYSAVYCTFHIREVGIFGGTASATPDSGTIISRALLDYDNSGGAYDLTFDYSLTIG